MNLILPLLLLTLTSPSRSDPDRPCRDQCGLVPVHYPFGIDDGCGAPQFRHMFTCNTSSNSLFFITLNGNYKVQSIDYKAQTMTVYDPDMSTCTILQPHHDLVLSDLQYAIIPPSPDTVFALLNCSLDSPLLHRFRSLCFDLPGHRCQDLYSTCNSFRVFTSGTGGPSISFGGYNNSAPGLAGAQPSLPNTGVYYGTPPPSVPYDNVELADTGPGYYNAPGAPNNFPISNSPPGQGLGGNGGNYYGTPGAPNNFPIGYSPPSLGDGGSGLGGGPYGTPGAPNNFPIGYSPPSLGDGRSGLGGGPSGNYYGGEPYGTPGAPNNFPIGYSPPSMGDGGGSGLSGGPSGNYYGAPGAPNNFPIGYSPPSLGVGGSGLGGGPSGNYYGAPDPISSTGGGGPSQPPPPCCFTGYSTMKVMSMDILDCTHFTSFYDVEKLKGVGPMEWSYGLRFSYSVPDMGCERCRKSGGSCGFDVQTQALLCLCPNANNSTRQCGTDDLDAGESWKPLSIFQGCIIAFGALFFLSNPFILLAIFV